MSTKADIATVSETIAIMTVRSTDLMRLSANADSNVKKVASSEKNDFFCGAGDLTGVGLTRLLAVFGGGLGDLCRGVVSFLCRACLGCYSGCLGCYSGCLARLSGILVSYR